MVCLMCDFVGERWDDSFKGTKNLIAHKNVMVSFTFVNQTVLRIYGVNRL